jgi:plastocyanin
MSVVHSTPRASTWTGYAQILSEAGRVTGRVRLTRARGTPLASNVYPARVVQQHDDPSLPELRNVVVYLKDVAFKSTLPASHREIKQQAEEFVPRVLAITKGSTVDFPNGDPFFHNVFSLSSADTFDLGRYKQGDTRSTKFLKPGLVKVYCHIHSHMSASILVLDHPYFAMPDNDGTFVLPDVPPGRYTIVGWHERVGERTASIQVDPGKVISVDLTVPVEDQR